MFLHLLTATVNGIFHLAAPGRATAQKSILQVFFLCFSVLTYPFQQSFEVVTHRCHEQAFVCKFQSPGVHSSHAQKVHQRTDHRLHGGLSKFLHSLALRALQALVHFIIEVFIHRVFDFFKVTFANATAPKGQSLQSKELLRYTRIW